MGLFDSFKGKTEQDLTVPEALLSVAIAAIAADGIFEEKEALRLKVLAFLNPLFPDDFDVITSNIVKVAAFNEKLGASNALEIAKKFSRPSLKKRLLLGHPI